jgi:hypothetical protein
MQQPCSCLTHPPLICRHELQVDSWEDVPFSNEAALAQAVSQTPVIVAICAGPAIDDWHHYTGAWEGILGC